MGHKGYEMSVELRITALKNLMVGRARDLYEDWVDSLVKQDTDTEWRALVNKVQDYATRRRLEAGYKG